MIFDYQLESHQKLSFIDIINFNKDLEYEKGVKVISLEYEQVKDQQFIIRKGIHPLYVNCDNSQRLHLHSQQQKLTDEEIYPFEHINFPLFKQQFSPPYLPTGFKLEMIAA